MKTIANIFYVIFLGVLLSAATSCAVLFSQTTQTSASSKKEVGYARPNSTTAAAAVTRTAAQGNSLGARVLTAALEMIENEVLVVGSCWDYVNEVYNRSGFPSQKRQRIYWVAESGPYADPSLLKPGDWIMYKNLPYGEIGHSAIFVAWVDFERRSALTIEYAGRNRAIPGRFREADIFKVFGILRGME